MFRRKTKQTAYQQSGGQSVEEVQSCDDLDNAIGEYQAGGQKDENYERYLINRGVELGCTDNIPDEFGL